MLPPNVVRPVMSLHLNCCHGSFRLPSVSPLSTIKKKDIQTTCSYTDSFMLYQQRRLGGDSQRLKKTRIEDNHVMENYSGQVSHFLRLTVSLTVISSLWRLFFSAIDNTGTCKGDHLKYDRHHITYMVSNICTYLLGKVISTGHSYSLTGCWAIHQEQSLHPSLF